MPLALDQYRSKLIHKILSARSDKDVIRFCMAAIKGFKRYNVNSYLIVRFADRMITELKKSNTYDKHLNITAAVNFFSAIKS